MLPKKGKGRGKSRDLACDTPAPPIHQATPPATPAVAKKEEEEWRAMQTDWTSRLGLAAKTLKNLMPVIRDPELRKAAELAEEISGTAPYKKFQKGYTFRAEEVVLDMLEEAIAIALKSEEYLDFDSESSGNDDAVTELRKEVKRMEKEIKRLKMGWSDLSEDVTSVKVLLSERKKEVEDLKAKVKEAGDMVVQVREGFQKRLQDAEGVALSQRQKLKETEEALKRSSEKEEGWSAQVTNLQNELKEEKERSETLDKMREANFQEAAKWKKRFAYLDNRFGEENVKAYTDAEERAKRMVEENDLWWEEKLKREVGLARGRGQTKDKQAQTEPQKSEKMYAEAAQQTPPVLLATPVPVSTASADVKGKG